MKLKPKMESYIVQDNYRTILSQSFYEFVKTKLNLYYLHVQLFYVWGVCWKLKNVNKIKKK